MLPGWHHPSDRHLPHCVPRGSEGLPKPRHSILQPSPSEAKPRHQGASTWLGRVKLLREQSLPFLPLHCVLQAAAITRKCSHQHH